MFDIFTLEINYQVLHSLQIRAEKLKKNQTYQSIFSQGEIQLKKKITICSD